VNVENTLYYGDNLDILRRYIADESVDRGDEGGEGEEELGG
jgi:hypothetical protein